MRPEPKQRLLAVLILANLALIWGNSLMTGEESGAVSGRFLEMLAKVLPFLATEAGHTFLRKAAHFSEFCLLGILTASRRLTGERELKPGFTGFGLAVACIDETIQIFVPGRGSSLMDVWIDTAGFAAGLILAFLGYRLIHHKS